MEFTLCSALESIITYNSYLLLCDLHAIRLWMKQTSACYEFDASLSEVPFSCCPWSSTWVLDGTVDFYLAKFCDTIGLKRRWATFKVETQSEALGLVLYYKYLECISEILK